MHKFAITLLAFLLAGLADPVLAAKIFWAPPISGKLIRPFPAPSFGEPLDQGSEVFLGESPHLRIEGTIEPGDDKVLQALLSEKLPDINRDMFNDVVVSFDSDGGDFYTGLRMSDVISRFAVATYVGAGDRCLSSCAMAFLGGQKTVARGLAPWPNRFVHADGMLGFHAPFSTLPSAIQVPNGTPFSNELAQQLANQFYGQAQTAVNEIARRMDSWQLEPDFVFAMLNKEFRQGDSRPIAEQFLLVNTYERLRQTGTALVAPGLDYPSEIGLLDAANACAFLSATYTGYYSSPFFLPGETRAFVNTDVVAGGDVSYTDNGGSSVRPIATSGKSRPVVRTSQVGGLAVTRLLPASGNDSFFLTGILTGLGPAQCNVFKSADGIWRAQSYNQNIHSKVNDGFAWLGGGLVLTRERVLDFDGPYPVNDYTRLGPSGVWNTFPAMKEPQASAGYLGRYPNITGPSFDCSGALDPSATVICENPALGRLDGVLGALYRDARAAFGDQVRNSQRQWVKVRNFACRPDRIDLSNAFSRRTLAECVQYFTAMRNLELYETMK